jgi:hypothetical protein
MGEEIMTHILNRNAFGNAGNTFRKNYCKLLTQERGAPIDIRSYQGFDGFYLTVTRDIGRGVLNPTAMYFFGHKEKKELCLLIRYLMYIQYLQRSKKGNKCKGLWTLLRSYKKKWRRK